jgi:hypothetical protein
MLGTTVTVKLTKTLDGSTIPLVPMTLSPLLDPASVDVSSSLMSFKPKSVSEK